MSVDPPPAAKRQKILSKNDSDDASYLLQTKLETWLGERGTATKPPQVMQQLLGNGVKIRQDIYKLQTLFDQVGFRTSIVQSPRLAASLYKDSCIKILMTTADNNNDDATRRRQQEYLLTMVGLHPDQTELEQYYNTHFRETYCLQRFLARLQSACPKAIKDPHVCQWIKNHDKNSNSNKNNNPSDIASLMKLMRQADHRLRQEQLDHELDRIRWYHCTLANALLQQFLATYHGCIIKDVFFKTSHVAKYERLTFYLYDPDIDNINPASNFVFLPDLSYALQTRQETSSSQPQSVHSARNNNMGGGTQAIVQNMMNTFWAHLLRHGGYHASTQLREQLTPAIERYFLSGLRQDPNIPLKLNAHFEPCEPLSLYLWGKAGSGKSSFVRHVPPALQAAVEAHADPEMLTRFVKQLLNKPYKDLCLELDLRPNNNDLSVMSIIQSRKCTMTQSKPGLVVIDLEEMPQYYYFDENNVDIKHHDPHQLQVCQLISQRFGGRKGNFDGTKQLARNSDKRGIGNDASLITLFTSNYTLAAPSLEALQRLAMFRHLTVVEMTAIDGEDRKQFAHAYFQQSILDRIQAGRVSSSGSTTSIDLTIMDMPFGEGDTRPLVRHLRMLAYYVSAIILKDRNTNGRSSSNGNTKTTSYSVSVVQEKQSCYVTVSDTPVLELHVGTLDNLFPVIPQIFDPRTQLVMDILLQNNKLEKLLSKESLTELATILDFWLGGALAPAVILSTDEHVIKTLIATIQETLANGRAGVHCITNIDASSYKMMKSLYDPRDTPNLREDILKLGGGKQGDNTALVAMELQCPTSDDQLCIREMIEDTPSMTAFSSDKSALYKTGLLFGVSIEGDCITPELHSRASLVL